jgi:hypothetical protein
MNTTVSGKDKSGGTPTTNNISYFRCTGQKIVIH